MKEIGNSQGPAFRCRYRRIVVLAGVVLAGFYCTKFENALLYIHTVYTQLSYHTITQNTKILNEDERFPGKYFFSSTIICLPGNGHRLKYVSAECNFTCCQNIQK